VITRLLAFLGLQLVYRCGWGDFPYRYGDRNWKDLLLFDIPRHPDYAPPWARMVFKKLSPTNPKGKS
jgi:hypothetical protein